MELLGPSADTVNDWLTSTFLGGLWLEVHTGNPGTNGASNIAATDGRQLTSFVISSTGVVQSSGAPPQFVIGGTVDMDITHGSLHTELDGGIWRWNMIARSPIRVVPGDVLIIGDGMEFRIDGWVA